jgi:hypothetical protein
MNEDYLSHYQHSREQFAKFVIESKHNPDREAWMTLHSMLGTEDMRNDVDEFNYAMQSYDDTAEQVKLLWTWESGHTLKIKWEHTGWWAGDVLHHYYCVMLPLKNVELFHPHELVRTKEVDEPVWEV